MFAVTVCTSGSLVKMDGAGVTLRVNAALRPGRSMRGEATILNASRLPASIRLYEEEPASHPDDEAIALAIDEITERGRERVQLGRIGSLAKGGVDLGRFLPGESRTYLFTVLRSSGAEPRAFSVRARYRWRVDGAGVER